ncbi:hypothetical protein [Amycolatopsis sp. cmx-8-4]|uniref:hypothetical protein n=1 Tax=Amycolatopsis sp. cmx-8-4 TaxID=2790947 RepID=UPI003979CFAA
MADEARDAGLSMADRTAWRICSSMGWWSAFGRKRGRNGKKAGPPVRDDLVRRDFTATAPNQLWLADISAWSRLTSRLAEGHVTWRWFTQASPRRTRSSSRNAANWHS